MPPRDAVSIITATLGVRNRCINKPFLQQRQHFQFINEMVTDK